VTHPFRSSVIAVAVAAGWALPAQAQSGDNAAIQQELSAMRAQMQRMASRIDSLEGQLATANAKADAAATAATAASNATAAIPAQIAAAQTATAKPATEVTWDGAPKLTTQNGWSFKPRGRLQVDIGSVSAPSPVMQGANNLDRELGFASEFRRAYIGFDGTMPGGFGYRVEADLAASSVNLTDLYLTYKPNTKITLTVGQYKPFWGLEDSTSDLFTSFQERASFNAAFGFERRLGVSAQYLSKTFLVQGGVFTDDVAALNADTDNSYSFDGRAVFMPRLGNGQLHIGGSIHYRRLKDVASSVSYGPRPFVHTTDLKFVSTGTISGVEGERGLGLEAAYINGRFHATAEAYWQKVIRTGLADPNFNGGYAEVGYLLTDDTTAYKGGVYDRIRPKNPVDKGGFGAVQVNARYDWLDLIDAGIIGGRQQTAGVSVIWIPTDYVRFIADYGHLWIKDSPVLAGGSPNYASDAFGLRAQFDF
jgi:phosphate-selective porin OprO/OprP